MNNAVFNIMENERNHVDVKLITKWNGRYGAEAMIMKPNFHSCSVFAENLIAVEMRKGEVRQVNYVHSRKSAYTNFTTSTRIIIDVSRQM